MNKKILTFIGIFMIITLLGCSNTTNNEIKSGKINCDNKNTIMNSNGILIDVRSTLEYNEGHLDNAINIPLDNLLEDIKTLNNINLDSPIVVYCKSGARSAKAFEALKNAGYTKIYDLGAISNCSK